MPPPHFPQVVNKIHGHFVGTTIREKIVGTLMLLYNLTHGSKIVDLKVKVLFSNDSRGYPFIYPLPIPYHSILGPYLGVTEDIMCMPTNIDLWGGGNIDGLQLKVLCQHFFRGL